MDSSKIIGWLLLVAGLILIIWTLVFSYNIFTAKSQVPEFFEMPEEKVFSDQSESQLEAIISQQLEGILPVDSIINLLNLVVWSMLAFILIFGGSQISSLGIKLIKK